MYLERDGAGLVFSTHNLGHEFTLHIAWMIQEEGQLLVTESDLETLAEASTPLGLLGGRSFSPRQPPECVKCPWVTKPKVPSGLPEHTSPDPNRWGKPILNQQQVRLWASS